MQRRVREQRGELGGVVDPERVEREARAGQGRRALPPVARSCYRGILSAFVLTTIAVPPTAGASLIVQLIRLPRSLRVRV
ncbi:MAG TPA: hypothetical protein VE526_15130 [Solirubrobacteraceae bacterium]|nr:hypothetical protein [Solirubrobacteraceae bacterium]